MNISTTAIHTAVVCAVEVLKRRPCGKIVMATVKDSIEMGHIDGLNPTEMRALLCLVSGIQDCGTAVVVDAIRDALSA